MPMTAGELNIILKAKDEASKVVRSAGKEIKGMGGIAQKASLGLGSIGKVLAGGAVFYTAQKAVRALAGELTKLVSAGMEAEQIRTAFHGMAADADKTLKAFRQGTAGMVTDIELMRTYNEAAQGVSKTFAEQLPDAMTYLRKVSASTGQSMDYMLNSLTTGIARLSPMILDNLKIQVSLSEAYEAYAASVGKSVEELSKAEQQTALMNAAMDKLRVNTANIPDVIGTASQMWGAFRTDLANVRGEIGESLIPAFLQLASPILPQVSEAIKTLGSDLIEGIKQSTELAGVIRESFGGGQFQDAFDLSGVNIANVLIEATRQIGLMAAAMDVLLAKAAATVQFVKATADELRIAFADGLFNPDKMREQGRPVGPLGPTDISTPAHGTPAPLAGPWEELTIALKEADAAYAITIAAINSATIVQKTEIEALAKAKDAWDEFKAGRMGIFDLVGAFKDVMRGEEEFVIQSGNAATQVSNEWKKAADTIASDMKTMLSGITQNAMDASKGLFDFGTSPEDLFKPGADGPFENIYRAQDIAVHGEGSPWAAMLGLTQEDARRIVTDFQAGLFTEDVKGLIDMPALANAAQMQAMAESSKKMFVDEIAKIAGIAPTAVSALLGTSDATTTGQIATDAANIAQDVKVAFDGKVEEMVKAGEALIRGVITGMNNTKQDLIDAAEAIAKAAAKAANDALAPPKPVTSGSGGTSPDGMNGASTFNFTINATGDSGSVQQGVLSALRAAGVA